MLNISINADSDFIETVGEVASSITKLLENDLAISLDFSNDDPDLADTWHESLLETLNSDCQYLLFLLGDEHLGSQNISIENELAIPALRACSAIRLKIQSLFLDQIPSAQLESGQVNPNSLSSEALQPYACYIFLAALQSSLISALDPSIGEL